jgi:hypothetical protein
VEKSVKTLAPAKRYRIELPEPSLVMTDGDVIVGMFGVGNVLTHVGAGMNIDIAIAIFGNNIQTAK